MLSNGDDFQFRILFKPRKKQLLEAKLKKHLKEIEERLLKEEKFSSTKFSSKSIRESITEVIQEIFRYEDKNRPWNLVKLKEIMEAKDSSLYKHSLDVCISSILFGIHLEYPKDKLIELGTGGLLHDIGKLRMQPFGIISKEGKLSQEEFEIIKEHPKLGYEFLISNPNDIIIAKIAGQHHLPRYGIQDLEVLTESEIIKIVDVFCALTEVRSYRKNKSQYSINEALNIMHKQHLEEDYYFEKDLFPIFFGMCHGYLKRD